MRITRSFRLPRIWSNDHLRRIAPLFEGEAVNVSAWDDMDKQGGDYRSYFSRASAYSITNFGGIRGAEVTWDFFETLGVEPILGRRPALSDVAGAGTPNMTSEAEVTVVLVSEAFWVETLGADPGVIGTTLDLNDRIRTIIGVVGNEVALPEEETSVWIPFEVEGTAMNVGQFRWNMVGRLTGGMEPNELAARLAPLAARLPELYSDSPSYVAFMVDGQYRPVVKPLQEELVGDLQHADRRIEPHDPI